MEKRLVEVDRILVHNETDGIFVFQAIHLTENKRRRKKSGPYTRGKSGRYVGELPVVLAGDIFECEVEITYSNKVGAWFRVYSAIRKAPVSLTQVERFLKKNIPGMTQDRLHQITDKYGLNTLQAIQHDPHTLDFAGLLPENSEELRDALNGMAMCEEIIIILQKNGVDCRFDYPLYRRYGLTAPRILQSDPYIPYLDKIDKKYDFHAADKLYLILYTAFTRAQKSVVLIGSEEELLKGLQKQERDRESNLCKRLQAQILHKTFSLPEPYHPAEPEDPVDTYEQQDLFAPALSASKLEDIPSRN